MSKIIEINGHMPIVPESCYVADGVIITGQVEMGEKCSIWFNTVIRGDVSSIQIGNNVNIQDLCMVHSTIGKSKTIIENNVSIGHRAIIHGAIIHSDVLIGMGAIVMDNAIVRSNTIVAAGAVVLENQVLESGFIYAGVPAKKIKKVDEEQLGFHVLRTSKAYIKYSAWYQRDKRERRLIHKKE